MGHTAFDQQVVVKVNDKLTSWTIFFASCFVLFVFNVCLVCVLLYILEDSFEMKYNQ